MGNTSRQTPIELTRKILARKHASSVQRDISRFLITDIGKDRQTQTWQKTLGNTSGRHQLSSLERYWKEKHASSVQIDISRFLTTNIDRKRQTQARKILG